MWIILEGPDRTGKSYLAERLKGILESECEVLVTHLGVPKTPTSALDEVIYGVFGSYVPGGIRHIVSDRHHWGCPVYGPIKRATADSVYGDFGRAGWRYTEMFVASRGGLTFLLTAPAEVIAKRIESEGEDYVEPAEMPAIVAKYEWLTKDSMTHADTIDTRDYDDEDLIDIIERARATEDVAAEMIWRGYVGSLQPERLVVSAPVRNTRLEIVDALPDDTWKRTGLIGPAAASILLPLWEFLGEPEVIGVGPLTAAADEFISVTDGRAVGTPEDLTFTDE